MLELEAGRSTYFPGEWHVWRREKAARALDASKSIERYNADIARLQRFVDRFRYKKSKAKQAQAKLTHIGRLQEGEGGRLRRARAAHAALEAARLRVPEPAAQRADGRRGRGPVALGGRQAAAGRRRRSRSSAASTSRSSARTAPGKTTLLETLLGRREPTRARPARPRRRARVLLPARGRARRARLGARVRPVDDRAAAAGGAEPARPLPLLRLGGAREGGARCSRAASGGGSRSRSWSRPARTSSSSTSRRTTSTSRAARRSRRRSRTSRRRCCSSRTTAPSSTRSPSERSRSRTGRSGATTAAGPTTSGRVPCGRRVPMSAQLQSQRLRLRNATKQATAGAATSRGAHPSSSRSRPRSSVRRRQSPSSSASSPTTDWATWTSSPRTAPRETSSSRCSTGGRRCSSRRRPAAVGTVPAGTVRGAGRVPAGAFASTAGRVQTLVRSGR